MDDIPARAVKKVRFSATKDPGPATAFRRTASARRKRSNPIEDPFVSPVFWELVFWSIVLVALLIFFRPTSNDGECQGCKDENKTVESHSPSAGSSSCFIADRMLASDPKRKEATSRFLFEESSSGRSGTTPTGEAGDEYEMGNETETTAEFRDGFTPGILGFGRPETTVLFLSATIGAASIFRLILGNVLPWLPLPMTVPLMGMGLLFGFCATKWPHRHVRPYMTACGLSSRSMMYLLLPGLTFDLCFKVPLHLFRQCSLQIFSISTIGLGLEMIMTISLLFFTSPIDMTGNAKFMFASLASLCFCSSDALAVVEVVNKAISYEDEGLPVILEGETMVNNAITVASHQILRTWVIHNEFPSAFSIFVYWLWPFLVGFVWARLVAIFMARIPQDPIVEILTTVVATYALFYVVDEFLVSAGVLAVMVFGLTLNWELEGTSPEIASARLHWWSVFAFVANACVFAINSCGMGQTIAQLADSIFSYEYLIYPTVVYGALLFIRLLTLLIMMLPLHYLGYEMSWEDGVVIVLGWLKGDMALTIAFMLSEDRLMQAAFSEYHMRLAFFWTIVVVFLTQMLNGFIMKFVLSGLKYDVRTQFQTEAMNIAVDELDITRVQALEGVRSDRSLYRSDWAMVDSWTRLENPYDPSSKVTLKQRLCSFLKKLFVAVCCCGKSGEGRVTIKGDQLSAVPTEAESDTAILRRASHILRRHAGEDRPPLSTPPSSTAVGGLLAQEPSVERIPVVNKVEESETKVPSRRGGLHTTDYVMRYLKAITMSAWKLHQTGLVSLKATKIISMKASEAIADGGPLLSFEAFKHTYDFGLFLNISIPLLRKIRQWSRIPLQKSPRPSHAFAQIAWRIRYTRTLKVMRIIVPVLHMASGVVDFVLTATTGRCFLAKRETAITVIATSVTFSVFYIFYFLLMTMVATVNTPLEFFGALNHLVLTLLALGEIGIDVVILMMTAGIQNYRRHCFRGWRFSGIPLLDLLSKAFRTGQILGIVDSVYFLTAFKKCTLALSQVVLWSLYKVFSGRLSLAYDVGRGILMAEEGVSKIMNDIVEEPQVAEQFLHHCTTVQRQWQAKLVQLRRENPYVTRAVKTKHAMMIVLKSMGSRLSDLQEEGILFEKEFTALEAALHSNLRRVLNKMPSFLIEKSGDMTILDGLIPWLDPQRILSHVCHISLVGAEAQAWMEAHKDQPKILYDFVKKRGVVKQYEPGQPMAFSGDMPGDIWLIMNGIVHVSGMVRHDVRVSDGGFFPNVENYANVVVASEKTQTSDFYGEGTVVGKIGLLTGQKRLSDVVCDTEVEAFNIKIWSLEPFVNYAALWYEVAVETALKLTYDHPFFNGWAPPARMRFLAEGRIYALKPEPVRAFMIYPWMTMVLVLQGQMINKVTNNVVQTPALVILGNVMSPDRKPLDRTVSFNIGPSVAEPIIFIVGETPPIAEIAGTYTLVPLCDIPDGWTPRRLQDSASNTALKTATSWPGGFL